LCRTSSGQDSFIKSPEPTGIFGKGISPIEADILIVQKQYSSINLLMEVFRVTKRIIYRYLELSIIIYTIEYDKERQEYRFADGDWTKKLVFSLDELIIRH